MGDEEYGKVLEIDCATGERTEREMTAEERERRDQRRQMALTEAAAQALREQERSGALERLRADPTQADLLKALRLDESEVTGGPPGRRERDESAS